MRTFKKGQNNRAFTLIELLVCITIFVIMTALLLFKYGNFNQSVLLTNLAYDTALTIRTAQNYGLSVKAVKDASGADVICSSSNFQCAYGVMLSSDPIGADVNNTKFILFADNNKDGQYNISAGDRLISTYTLKRGATISLVCAGSESICTVGSQISINFMRPDPSADICLGTSCGSTYTYAKITIKGTDNTTRSISVRSNGQISVDI